MPLTHVCVWDSKTGYRRVTVEEACEMYPYGASARSGHFVCELCAQNVLLTAPGMNVQHFRHDPASPNKECDERQASFDPNYGRSLRALNSHIMPLRLVVTGSIFSLQLGFFYPPDNKAHCDKIKIAGDSHQVYEYSFERIERIGTTYLSVGSIPSQIYGVEYVNANTELKRFWSNKITGINTTGSFFDGRTGQILQSGGKAYSGNSYYLLQRCPLYSYHTDIEATEVARNQASPFTTWYLYKIRIKKFSAYSAKFFLKYAIFLTEKPTKFYPIWPAYINDPYFIYHNSPEFYFYLCGDDAELKSYPATANVLGIQDGKLYMLIEPKGLYNYMLPVLSECFIGSLPALETWPSKRAEKFQPYVSEEKQSLRISAFKRLGLSKLLLGQLTRVLSDAKCILENPAKDKDLELLFGVLPLCVLTGRLDVLKDVIEGESGISSSVKAEVARYIEEE